MLGAVLFGHEEMRRIAAIHQLAARPASRAGKGSCLRQKSR